MGADGADLQNHSPSVLECQLSPTAVSEGIPVLACRGIVPALPRLPAWGQAPALLKGPGVVGVKLQCLVEVAAGLLVAAQVQVGGAAAAEGVEGIGGELQRTVEVAERLLVAAQVEVGDAAAAEDVGVVG